MRPIVLVICVLPGLPWDAAAAPVPSPTRPGKRPPTPAEWADARKAYMDLGGSAHRERIGFDETYYRFSPGRLTAETVAKLPDLPFEYMLELYLRPETAPGTLKELGRLKNLRWVSVRVHPIVRPDKDPDPARLIPELAVVPNLE